MCSSSGPATARAYFFMATGVVEAVTVGGRGGHRDRRRLCDVVSGLACRVRVGWPKHCPSCQCPHTIGQVDRVVGHREPRLHRVPSPLGSCPSRTLAFLGRPCTAAGCLPRTRRNDLGYGARGGPCGGARPGQGSSRRHCFRSQRAGPSSTASMSRHTRPSPGCPAANLSQETCPRSSPRQWRRR